jgi:hypothetical protein
LCRTRLPREAGHRGQGQADGTRAAPRNGSQRRARSRRPGARRRPAVARCSRASPTRAG